MTAMTMTQDVTLDAGVARETAVFPILMWPLSRIDDNPYQPRREYETGGIIELAENIRSLKAEMPATLGLQQIPMARLMRYEIDSGEWVMIDRETYRDSFLLRDLQADNMVLAQLCFGHRRLRAWKLLHKGIEKAFPELAGNVSGPAPDVDYEAMPLQLVFAEDLVMWQHAVSENAQRKDITAIEEAVSMRRVMDEFGLTTEEAARPFGFARSTAANKLRLLDLPEDVQELILRGEISEKHGRLLLPLSPAPKTLAKLAEKLQDEQWGTRELQKEVRGAVQSYRPVPDEPVEFINKNEWRETAEKPWDMDWAPDDKKVEGACAGCTARVTMGDKVPRCLKTSCYSAKAKLWKVEDERRQREAARVAMDAMGMEYVPILEKRRDQYNDEAQILRTDYAADARLIDEGVFGPGCDRLAAQYCPDSGWQARAAWRPDPEGAPLVFFVLTDREFWREKTEPIDEEIRAERDAKVAAEIAADPARAEHMKEIERRNQERAQATEENHAAAAQKVDAFVDGIGGVDKLWSHRGFLIELIVSDEWPGHQQARRKELADAAVPELQRHVLGALVGECMQPLGGGIYGYGEQFQALMNRLSPPPAQPKPGDSQETDWEDGWDDADDAEYAGIVDAGAWFREDIRRPRVALRLIEGEADKDLRSILWKRYNELSG